MTLELINNNNTKKLSFLIFSLVFVVFLFSSDGHRYTIDEFLGQDMALHMTTLEPDPSYVQGESKNFFNAPIFNVQNNGPFCKNAITCYPVSIFYSITEVPFIAINHYFHIITDDTLILSIDEFAHPHYNFWRNSENVDIVFMELTYGPLLSALSVVIFFLICIEQKFSRNISITLTFLFGFSTLIWAYSNTSLNLLPTCLFLLLGYLFFKKFQRLNQNKFLLFSSASLGFGFLIRHDLILFIIPIFFLLLISILNKNKKINSLFVYSIPLLFSYFTTKIIHFLQYEPLSKNDSIPTNDPAQINAITELIYNFPITRFFIIPVPELLAGVFGILFAPGVGLFIFCPIFLTIFFTFPDFFRKRKSDCILFLSFILLVFYVHATNQTSWHGLVGWGPRYLFLLLPFLLIPLGASIEKRNRRLMIPIILVLGGLGIFFNIAYVIQDVSWFVWGAPGTNAGLYGIATASTPMYLHPDTIWTFQFSQLTHSILLMFEGLQHDIYLLHVFGSLIYVALFATLIFILGYLFLRTIRNNKILT